MADEVVYFTRPYGMFETGEEVVVISGGDASTVRVHSAERGYTVYAPRTALSSIRPAEGHLEDSARARLEAFCREVEYECTRTGAPSRQRLREAIKRAQGGRYRHGS